MCFGGILLLAVLGPWIAMRVASVSQVVAEVIDAIEAG